MLNNTLIGYKPIIYTNNNMETIKKPTKRAEKEINKPQLLVKYNDHIICQRFFSARNLDKYKADMPYKLEQITSLLHQHLCKEADAVRERYGNNNESLSDPTKPVILNIITLLENKELGNEYLDITSLPNRVKFHVNIKPVLDEFYAILRDDNI